MIPSVEVFTSLGGDDVRTGIARFSLRRGAISTTFTYDGDYLAHPYAYAIDPSMPLSARTHHAEGLPGAFRDSAPDRWGRNLVAKRYRVEARKKELAMRSLDEVDYLTGVFDQTRQGALRYRTSQNTEWLSPHKGVPPLIQLPELLRASRSLAQESEGTEELKLLLDAGSGSLGGARPKASIHDGARLLLAKFSHRADEWDVMAWEKTALDIARVAGIRVPGARLVRVGAERVLLLERFDRRDSLYAGMRLPYVSAMSLLGARDGDARDYSELAEDAGFFVADPNAELADLFTRIALLIALHSTDDHLRNHGFLRMSGGWTLSPMFDVNPNPYLDSGRVTSVFGESGAREAIALADLLDVFGLSRQDASVAVSKVLDAMADWRAIARTNGCKEAEISMFAPVFSNRMKALETAFEH